MVEAQEQTSDLMWAMSVIRGKGDEHDSVEHAEWIIKQIEENGATLRIRKRAAIFLEGMGPRYGNSRH